MNGIIGTAEILNTLDISQEQKRILAIMRNSAFSLLTVKNNILGVSKLDSGNIIIEESRTDLVTLSRELFFLLPISGDLGFKFVMSIDPEFPRWVHVDGDRLIQVLMNVLKNSVKCI